MPRRRPPILLPVVVAGLTLALAACGGSDPPSETARVTTAVERFLRAQSAGEAETVCGLLTPAGQRRLVAVVRDAVGTTGTGLTCEQAGGLARVAAGVRVMEALGDAAVRDPRVTGDRATVLVVDGAAFGPRRVRLRRSGGQWRIDAVPGLIG